MELTVKTRYGLKVLLDVSWHGRHGTVQRRHILARQGIPGEHLDLVLSRLRRYGLIRSFRGREGGYFLAKEPSEITLWDVVNAVEEERDGRDARRGDWPNEMLRYVVEPALDDLVGVVRRSLKRVTLGMLLEEAEDRMLEDGVDPLQFIAVKPGTGAKTTRPVPSIAVG